MRANIHSQRGTAQLSHALLSDTCSLVPATEVKAFWTAFEEAQESNAKLLSAEAEKAPRQPAEEPEDSVGTEKSVSKAAAVAEEEEGEEVSSKAADALADTLGGVKVKEDAK